ncbi:MAG: hypothetical protein AAB389_04360 [Patescibacteria group bacterium]
MSEKKKCKHVNAEGDRVMRCGKNGKTYCAQCGKPIGNGMPTWLLILIWPIFIPLAFMFLPEVLINGSPADRKDVLKFIGITLMTLGFTLLVGIWMLELTPWWVAILITYPIPGVILAATAKLG